MRAFKKTRPWLRHALDRDRDLSITHAQNLLAWARALLWRTNDDGTLTEAAVRYLSPDDEARLFLDEAAGIIVASSGFQRRAQGRIHLRLYPGLRADVIADAVAKAKECTVWECGQPLKFGAEVPEGERAVVGFKRWPPSEPDDVIALCPSCYEKWRKRGRRRGAKKASELSKDGVIYTLRLLDDLRDRRVRY